MKKLIWTPKFLRAADKFITKYPGLIPVFKDRISRLENNPYDPVLKTHSLKGSFSGLSACSINYYFRIVFEFDSINDDNVILLNIGSHDEVY